MHKLLATALLVLACFPAHAICVSDGTYTYGGAIDAADHVFIATITRATLADDPASLQSRRWYRVDYHYAVRAVLKGDPSAVGHLESSVVYDAPDGHDVRIGESTAWQPGDVVLVVAHGAGPANIAFCSDSKPFDWAVSLLKQEGRHDLDAFLATQTP